MIDKLIIPNLPEWNNIDMSFREILDSKSLTTGKWTELAENKLKEIHNCNHALLTGSGTMAFLLLLQSIDYKFDKIYMQDFTWKSTKLIAEWLYPGKVEYVDVNKETWLAEEPSFDKGLFIPTMTFGNVKTYNYPNTIYDSAHCCGLSECNGRGFGEIISFSPAKNFTACEGGAIITNNEKVYKNAKKLRRFIGRIPEFNARVLFHNLENHKVKLIKKKDNFDKYQSSLDEKYKLQKIALASSHSEVGVVIENIRNKITDKMKKEFEIRIRYEPSNDKNEVSVKLYNNIIILPSSPAHEIDKYIKLLNQSILDKKDGENYTTKY